MKKYVYYIILILMVAVPSTMSAQVHNSNSKRSKTTTAKTKEHKSIQVNKLEVIDPDDEYSGVVNDRNIETEVTTDEGDMPDYDDNEPTYQRPFIINPPDPEEEDVETQYYLYQTASSGDEGAESEDEILLAGDSTLIHTPKMDLSELTQPLTIQLTNPQAGEMFVFPTPPEARVSSHFGPRRRRFHYGVDLALHTGEPIYAAFDGVVRLSKYNGSYGNLIVIRHNNGLETYYAHLSKRHVTPGTQVRAGDIIGLCGNTGRSYGSHLHFEIRYRGNAMNPENVIDCDSRTLLSPNLKLTKDSFRKVAKKGVENRSANTRSRRSDAGNYSGNGKYYKVRSGDTLSRIAQRNGTTVKKLCQMNGIKETSLLQLGQKIRVK